MAESSPHIKREEVIRQCSICVSNLNESYIKCVECRRKVTTLCIPCFQLGAESGEHSRGHNYEVIDPVGPPICPTGSDGLTWHLSDDLTLFDFVREYKLGNWEELARFFPDKRKALAARNHFDQFFLNGAVWNHVKSSEEPSYEGPSTYKNAFAFDPSDETIRECGRNFMTYWKARVTKKLNKEDAEELFEKYPTDVTDFASHLLCCPIPLVLSKKDRPIPPKDMKKRGRGRQKKTDAKTQKALWIAKKKRLAKLRKRFPESLHLMKVRRPFSDHGGKVKDDDLNALGYMPARDDFEVEIRNRSELLICGNTLFERAVCEPGKEFENEVKRIRLQRYRRDQKEREVAKGTVREFSLVSKFVTSLKTNADRKPKKRFDEFLQRYSSCFDHELVSTVKRFYNIHHTSRSLIEKYKRLRLRGITVMTVCPPNQKSVVRVNQLSQLLAVAQRVLQNSRGGRFFLTVDGTGEDVEEEFDEAASTSSATVHSGEVLVRTALRPITLRYRHLRLLKGGRDAVCVEFGDLGPGFVEAGRGPTQSPPSTSSAPPSRNGTYRSNGASSVPSSGRGTPSYYGSANTSSSRYASPSGSVRSSSSVDRQTPSSGRHTPALAKKHLMENEKDSKKMRRKNSQEQPSAKQDTKLIPDNPFFSQALMASVKPHIPKVVKKVVQSITRKPNELLRPSSTGSIPQKKSKEVERQRKKSNTAEIDDLFNQPCSSSSLNPSPTPRKRMTSKEKFVESQRPRTPAASLPRKAENQKEFARSSDPVRETRREKSLDKPKVKKKEETAMRRRNSVPNNVGDVHETRRPKVDTSRKEREKLPRDESDGRRRSEEQIPKENGHVKDRRTSVEMAAKGRMEDVNSRRTERAVREKPAKEIVPRLGVNDDSGKQNNDRRRSAESHGPTPEGRKTEEDLVDVSPASSPSSSPTPSPASSSASTPPEDDDANLSQEDHSTLNYLNSLLFKVDLEVSCAPEAEADSEGYQPRAVGDFIASDVHESHDDEDLFFMYNDADSDVVVTPTGSPSRSTSKTSSRKSTITSPLDPSPQKTPSESPKSATRRIPTDSPEPIFPKKDVPAPLNSLDSLALDYSLIQSDVSDCSSDEEAPAVVEDALKQEEKTVDAEQVAEISLLDPGQYDCEAISDDDSAGDMTLRSVHDESLSLTKEFPELRGNLNSSEFSDSFIDDILKSGSYKEVFGHSSPVLEDLETAGSDSGRTSSPIVDFIYGPLEENGPMVSEVTTPEEVTTPDEEASTSFFKSSAQEIKWPTTNLKSPQEEEAPGKVPSRYENNNNIFASPTSTAHTESFDSDAETTDAVQQAEKEENGEESMVKAIPSPSSSENIREGSPWTSIAATPAAEPEKKQEVLEVEKASEEPVQENGEKKPAKTGKRSAEFTVENLVKSPQNLVSLEKPLATPMENEDTALDLSKKPVQEEKEVSMKKRINAVKDRSEEVDFLVPETAISVSSFSIVQLEVDLQKNEQKQGTSSTLTDIETISLSLEVVMKQVDGSPAQEPAVEASPLEPSEEVLPMLVDEEADPVTTEELAETMDQEMAISAEDSSKEFAEIHEVPRSPEFAAAAVLEELVQNVSEGSPRTVQAVLEDLLEQVVEGSPYAVEAVIEDLLKKVAEGSPGSVEAILEDLVDQVAEGSPDVVNTVLEELVEKVAEDVVDPILVSQTFEERPHARTEDSRSPHGAEISRTMGDLLDSVEQEEAVAETIVDLVRHVEETLDDEVVRQTMADLLTDVGETLDIEAVVEETMEDLLTRVEDALESETIEQLLRRVGLMRLLLPDYCVADAAVHVFPSMEELKTNRDAIVFIRKALVDMRRIVLNRRWDGLERNPLMLLEWENNRNDRIRRLREANLLVEEPVQEQRQEEEEEEEEEVVVDVVTTDRRPPKPPSSSMTIEDYYPGVELVKPTVPPEELALATLETFPNARPETPEPYVPPRVIPEPVYEDPNPADSDEDFEGFYSPEPEDREEQNQRMQAGEFNVFTISPDYTKSKWPDCGRNWEKERPLVGLSETEQAELRNQRHRGVLDDLEEALQVEYLSEEESILAQALGEYNYEPILGICQQDVDDLDLYFDADLEHIKLLSDLYIPTAEDIEYDGKEPYLTEIFKCMLYKALYRATKDLVGNEAYEATGDDEKDEVICKMDERILNAITGLVNSMFVEILISTATQTIQEARKEAARKKFKKDWKEVKAAFQDCVDVGTEILWENEADDFAKQYAGEIYAQEKMRSVVKKVCKIFKSPPSSSSNGPRVTKKPPNKPKEKAKDALRLDFDLFLLESEASSADKKLVLAVAFEDLSRTLYGVAFEPLDEARPSVEALTSAASRAVALERGRFAIPDQQIKKRIQKALPDSFTLIVDSRTSVIGLSLTTLWTLRDLGRKAIRERQPSSRNVRPLDSRRRLRRRKQTFARLLASELTQRVVNEKVNEKLEWIRNVRLVNRFVENAIWWAAKARSDNIFKEHQKDFFTAIHWDSMVKELLVDECKSILTSEYADHFTEDLLVGVMAERVEEHQLSLLDGDIGNMFDDYIYSEVVSMVCKELTTGRTIATTEETEEFDVLYEVFGRSFHEAFWMQMLYSGVSYDIIQDISLETLMHVVIEALKWDVPRQQKMISGGWIAPAAYRSRRNLRRFHGCAILFRVARIAEGAKRFVDCCLQMETFDWWKKARERAAKRQRLQAYAAQLSVDLVAGVVDQKLWQMHLQFKILLKKVPTMNLLLLDAEECTEMLMTMEVNDLIGEIAGSTIDEDTVEQAITEAFMEQISSVVEEEVTIYTESKKILSQQAMDSLSETIFGDVLEEFCDPAVQEILATPDVAAEPSLDDLANVLEDASLQESGSRKRSREATTSKLRLRRIVSDHRAEEVTRKELEKSFEFRANALIDRCWDYVHGTYRTKTKLSLKPTDEECAYELLLKVAIAQYHAHVRTKYRHSLISAPVIPKFVQMCLMDFLLVVKEMGDGEQLYKSVSKKFNRKEIMVTMRNKWEEVKRREPAMYVAFVEGILAGQKATEVKMVPDVDRVQKRMGMDGREANPDVDLSDAIDPLETEHTSHGSVLSDGKNGSSRRASPSPSKGLFSWVAAEEGDGMLQWDKTGRSVGIADFGVLAHSWDSGIDIPFVRSGKTKTQQKQDEGGTTCEAEVPSEVVYVRRPPKALLQEASSSDEEPQEKRRPPKMTSPKVLLRGPPKEDGVANNRGASLARKSDGSPSPGPSDVGQPRKNNSKTNAPKRKPPRAGVKRRNARKSSSESEGEKTVHRKNQKNATPEPFVVVDDDGSPTPSPEFL